MGPQNPVLIIKDPILIAATRTSIISASFDEAFRAIGEVPGSSAAGSGADGGKVASLELLGTPA